MVLSLLNDCLVTFRNSKDPVDFIQLLIPRRSLYIQKDVLRYAYTHQITPLHGRRISIIFRDNVHNTV
jgi:hypothetical protein